MELYNDIGCFVISFYMWKIDLVDSTVGYTHSDFSIIVEFNQNFWSEFVWLLFDLYIYGLTNVCIQGYHSFLYG